MYYGTPPIVTSGLVLNLDAANSLSIPNDPVKNLLYTDGTYTPSISNLTVNTTLTTIDPNVKFRISTSTYINPYTFGSFRLNIPLNVLTSGKPYTLSYNYQIISGSLFQMNDWCDAALFNTVNINYGSYSYSSATGVRSVYDSTFRFMDFSINSSSIVDIWDIQLVQNTYSPTFTSSSRATWFDLSGLNNTTTLTTSSSSGSIPQYSFANQRILNFDGSSSFADTNIDLGWGTGSSITLEMWIKAAGTSSAAFLGTPAFEWQLKQGVGGGSTKNNNLVYVYWDTAGFHTNGPIITINNYFDTNWKHLVLTWNSASSTTSIYRNGELMIAQISGNPAANRVAAQTTRIGGSVNSWGAVDPYWSGSIQNFRVYNRALSQQEVTQNYNALKSRFGLQ